jgi:hypothetical protein
MGTTTSLLAHAFRPGVRLGRRLGRWLKREDGNSTIEFCIWVPFVLGMFGSSIEASFIGTRQAMMAGAMDRVIREYQLGYLGQLSHSQLKAAICNTAGVIPDCMNRLNLEMEIIKTENFAFRRGRVNCVDTSGVSGDPLVNFTNGGGNDLMLLTACVAVRPMVPITGLGLILPKIGGSKDYALVSYAAYVIEP